MLQTWHSVQVFTKNSRDIELGNEGRGWWTFQPVVILNKSYFLRLFILVWHVMTPGAFIHNPRKV